MKNINRFAIAALLSYSTFTFADPVTANCATCTKVDALIAAKDIDGASGFLTNFEFSKDSRMVTAEAQAITRLSLAFITKNGDGEVDEFYYDIFKQNPAVMKAVLNSLNVKDKNFLVDSYCRVQHTFKAGNGNTAYSPKEKCDLDAFRPKTASLPEPTDGAGISPCLLNETCPAKGKLPDRLPVPDTPALEDSRG